MGLPLVVIVGRPNVGKSSLLNALARQRISIVDARAGVTRDRVSAVIEHQGRYFELVDTGGVGMVDDDQLDAHVAQQIRQAIRRADAAVLLVDAQQGLLPLDRAAAELLRRAGKPVVLAANKVDEQRHEPGVHEFARLGCGQALCLSALHGRGRRELLDRLVELLGPGAAAEPGEPVMKLAILGKRNAGKSTLVNTLAGEARMIVSEVPGTTRDAVDVEFERDGRRFLAIDTAGLRKKRRMQDLAFYSYTRALRSIRRADVVMQLIDATVPVSEVDLKLAGAVLAEYKPVLLAINKWDLVGRRAGAADYRRYLTQVMPAVDYAPVVCLSATSGCNVPAAIDLALDLHRQARTRVGTGRLNAALQAVLAARGPSPRRGTRPVRLYYATQVATAPPTIVCFCNDPALLGQNYRRFLEQRLRARLPYRQVPIRLLFRPRGTARRAAT